MSARHLYLAALLGSFAFSGSAMAETCRTHREYDQGRLLRERGDNAGALQLFRTVYEQTHETCALARMALAEAALGRHEIAEEHLVSALAQTNDEWITRNREGFERELQEIRRHIGNLDVRSSTPGASLWIGGRQITRLPAHHPIRTSVGSIVIEVRAEGHQPESRSVDVRAGETTTIELDLAPSDSQLPMRTDPNGPTTRVNPLPWVILTAGALAVGTSAVLYLAPYQSARDDLAILCPTDRCTPSSLAEGQELSSRMNLLGGLSIGLVGFGAAALVSSVLWLAAGGGRTAPTHRVTATLAPGLGGAWLQLGATF